jgi:hypothetical protein
MTFACGLLPWPQLRILGFEIVNIARPLLVRFEKLKKTRVTI